MQGIPQLEKFVMEGLFWSDTPMLQTIPTHEGLTLDLRERLTSLLETALPPMDAYLALYEPCGSRAKPEAPPTCCRVAVALFCLAVGGGSWPRSPAAVD